MLPWSDVVLYTYHSSLLVPAPAIRVTMAHYGGDCFMTKHQFCWYSYRCIITHRHNFQSQLYMSSACAHGRLLGL